MIAGWWYGVSWPLSVGSDRSGDPVGEYSDDDL